MSQALFFSHLLRAAPRVVVRRLKRGPARTGWSLGFELVVAAMRGTAAHAGAGSWTRLRRVYDAIGKAPSPALRQVTRAPVRAGGVPAEWFSPRAPGDRTVLFFHGGGYVFGSTVSHADLIARVAIASNAKVLAPNYRLAPEHRYPAALDDALAAYRFLLDEGVSPSSIVVAGDSAGGGLTAALLLRLRDEGHPLPAGGVLVCPWVDLSAEGGSLVHNADFDWIEEAMGRRWIAAYLGDHPRTHPYASPALADLSGLPPMLVQVGGAELLFDQARRFASRAREQGTAARLVVEPEMVHDWHTLAAFFPECGRALADIGTFVRARTRGARDDDAPRAALA